MIEQLQQKIAAVLAVAGVPVAVVEQLQISDPPNAALGDVALAAFPLAMFWQISSIESAEKIKGLLLQNLNLMGEVVEEINLAGPYLNIRLRVNWLIKHALASGDSSWAFDGIALNGKSPTPVIMVEYCQPNTHKEFHIGHLRNLCYGSALINILRATGKKIIAATYNNDVGSHVAKCLWAYKKFHGTEKPPTSAQAKGRWLAGMYVEATRALDEHPEWKDEVSAMLRALEVKEPIATKLWKTTRAWSLAQFRAIYKELGVKFDVSFDESAVKDGGHKIVDELMALGIARASEGAIIMDFEAQKKGVLIIRKSDGTGNYATSDMALAQEKFCRHKINESVIITDNRQSLYFEQLFLTLRAYGFKQKMTHLGYDLVTLPEGAMSSRKGNVILFETLRDEVLESAREEIKRRHSDWAKRKVEKTAQAITVATIKFTMLKSSPTKVITFDKHEATAFGGFTASYLLYTLARVNSIRKRAGRNFFWLDGITKKKYTTIGYSWLSNERMLWLTLSKHTDVINRSAAQNDPSEITKHIFDLAQAFSSYYENTKVLDGDKLTRGARLGLITAIATTIESALTMLGIPLIDEM